MIETVAEKKSDGLYKWIGDLFWKLKDKNNALDAFYKSLEIKPNQPEIHDRIKKTTGKRVDTQRLAEKIVNCSLNCYDNEYAGKALEFLKHSIYKEGTFDYYDKLASIYEIQKDYESAISIRSQVDELELLEPQFRFKNLRVVAELITENRLYRYKSLKSKCIKKIEDFIRKNISAIDEGLTTETETDIEEIEENTYIFCAEIEFLAKHYLKNGYYAKAHQYIQMLTTSNKYELQSDKVYLQIDAKIFFEEERFDDAKRVAHKILKIEGDDPYALFLLGRIYRHKKEYSDAIRYFQMSYKASGGRIDALDQMGATYREWAKEPTLIASEKAGMKKKAIDCYTTILDRKRNDKHSRYGLAKSYLLEPLNENDIPHAVEILTAMLKSTIKDKDIDRKAIIELLSLWRDYHNDTIKKLILGTHELTIGLTDDDRCLLIREIIEIAKDENFFEQNVIDIFKTVFKENHDKGIRLAICKFLMKYLIYKFQQQISLQEIQGIIKEMVGLILKTNQYEATGYLAELLGSERDAYLEFLTEKIYPEIKGIQDSIWKLDEENSNEISAIAGQLQNNIKDIKDKLNAFEPFSFDRELENIRRTIEAQEEFYRRKAREDIELTINMAGIEDIHIPISAWERVDGFIFDSLDNIRDSHISGYYSLMVEQNDGIISFLITSKFPDSQEDLQDIIPLIKNSFDTLHHKDFKTVFSHLSDGFYTWIIFEVKDRDITRYSTLFNKLLDFLMSTYALPVSHDYWKEVYRLTREEVDLNNSNIKEEISNHILIQLGELFSMSKNYVDLFLKAPHDLEKLRNEVYSMSQEDRKFKIITVKNAFRNISFFTRNFLYPDTQGTFNLKDVILTIVNEFSYIPLRQGIQVKIDFKPEIEVMFLFTGSREHIEAVIRNLFHNAYKSMNKKLDNSPSDFKPAIQISLCKEEDAYKILFSDNGEGIPDGSKINDFLKKELNPDSKQKTGTGVGLSLILTIVNRFKGNFEVFSGRTGENSFATFIIKLPILGEEKQS